MPDVAYPHRTRLPTVARRVCHLGSAWHEWADAARPAPGHGAVHGIRDGNAHCGHRAGSVRRERRGKRRRLCRDRDSDRAGGFPALAATRGLAAIGLGISISLDELAIGFTLGLLRFSIPLVIALIGIQTLVVTQAGLRLGSRMGEAVRERAEQLAAVVLAALGLVLLGQRLFAA